MKLEELTGLTHHSCLQTVEVISVKPIKSIVTLGVDLNVEVTVNGEKISLKELKELLNKD